MLISINFINKNLIWGWVLTLFPIMSNLFMEIFEIKLIFLDINFKIAKCYELLMKVCHPPYQFESKKLYFTVLNSKIPSIKFTLEKMLNNKRTFPDILFDNNNRNFLPVYFIFYKSILCNSFIICYFHTKKCNHYTSISQKLGK